VSALAELPPRQRQVIVLVRVPLTQPGISPMPSRSSRLRRSLGDPLRADAPATASVVRFTVAGDRGPPDSVAEFLCESRGSTSGTATVEYPQQQEAPARRFRSLSRNNADAECSVSVVSVSRGYAPRRAIGSQ
jgi:hypothetical protein